ncbi:hypothetical protein PQR46_07435 [Paraburkholderia sediminicola]|uniref:hypothetical protein n=1 Tax=Paraburkholderia sediminicola TaxID=458836 RepID=UPI0038B9030F
MKRFARIVLYLVATVVLGDLLARYIAGLPYEMTPLTDSIQFVLHAVGLKRLDNVDDMETLALVFILLASIVAVAVVLWLAIRGGRALLARAGK